MSRRGLFSLLCWMSGLSLWGAYGVKCNVNNPASCSTSIFAPVNAQVFHLRQPDGVERLFIRDLEEPNLLHGKSPWVAELDGSKALVMTDPEFKGGQTGFMFLSGHLRNLLLDGKEFQIPLPVAGAKDGDIASLWPPREKRLVSEQAPDIWNKGKRLRLWFDNPNKAGLLFTELGLVCLALVFLRPFWCRLMGGTFFLASFVGLVLTSSRGGLLALLCGLFLMGLTRIKAFLDWKRLLTIVVVVAVAIGCVFALKQGDRLGRKLLVEGQRETSRLTVWKEVPRMMVDAPNGWGLGKSARAYIDWYQEKNDCLLKDMISGHLTFLVETGWGVRGVYVFLWAAFLFGAFICALKGASPVPVAVGASFAVAACFNPVVKVVELLLAPTAMALVSFVAMLKARRRLQCLWIIGSLGVALAICFSAWMMGKASSREGSVPVRCRGAAVCLNGNEPKAWIVHDDYVLHGGYWWLMGKEIRTYFKAHADAPCVAISQSLQGIPKKVETLALVGESAREYLAQPSDVRPQARHIILISPPFSWKQVAEDILKEADVRMVVGELAVGSLKDYQTYPRWVECVPGAELYLPQWLDLILNNNKKKEQKS